MKIDKEYIEFLNSQKNNIATNNFMQVYDTLEHNFRLDESIITQCFLEAGINPLIYMHKIPSGYLKNSEITEFNIPDNISCIGEQAFYGCTHLQKINVHPGITAIQAYAFYNCPSLNIRIPKTVKYIGSSAFNNCSKIIYEGSAKEFDDICGHKSFVAFLNIEFENK